MSTRLTYPFSAIVGQDDLKTALLINAVDPLVGGVLVRGEKGTAKSTAVRALAAVLPEIAVVDGCRYGCDPFDRSEWCGSCRERAAEGPVPRARRAPAFVDLPVSATEDRLVGTLDIEDALTEGRRTFEPGLLADAHRGILYIDEVNLLDDHLTDTLLDVAAMGVNLVEREGISYSHPSRFILVGTMNPEEGDVRPQLLDRFGLCVDIRGLSDPEDRMRVVRLRQDYESDPDAFRATWSDPDSRLTTEMEAAQARLVDTVLSDDVLRMITTITAELAVDGHRADLTMTRAAIAYASLLGRDSVETSDVRRVAPMVLAHRLRRRPFEDDEESQTRMSAALGATDASDERSEPHQRDASSEPGVSEPEKLESLKRMVEGPPEEGEDTLVSHPLTEAVDRDRRSSSGRRQATHSDDGRGRYVRSEPVRPGAPVDVAVDATLREAAVHQRARGAAERLDVRRSDLRNKVRERRVGASIVFCVDASGSMAAATRMEAAKTAVLELLVDAYQRRDRVGLVAFHGERADVLLSPTGSVELAQMRLKELPTGGATPLAHGIKASLEVLDAERRRDDDVVPWLVLVTDGRANVALGRGLGSDEARTWASRVREVGVHSVVLDTDGPGSRGAARDLAELAGASYVRLGHVDGSEMAGAVRDALVAV